MTRKKPNVSPADVGGKYVDTADNVFRLEDCGVEPIATMRKITGVELTLTKPISDFKDFVRLRPERLIAKPVAPRKVRKDKDTHREKKQEPAKTIPLSTEAERNRVTEKLKKRVKGSPDISAFSVITGQGDQLHKLRIGEVEVKSATLQGGVAVLLSTLGINEAYIENAPESEGKRELLAILKGGNVKEINNGSGKNR